MIYVPQVEVFETDPMIRNLPDLVTKPDLIRLQNDLQFCKKQYGRKTRL